MQSKSHCLCCIAFQGLLRESTSRNWVSMRRTRRLPASGSTTAAACTLSLPHDYDAHDCPILLSAFFRRRVVRRRCGTRAQLGRLYDWEEVQQASRDDSGLCICRRVRCACTRGLRPRALHRSQHYPRYSMCWCCGNRKTLSDKTTLYVTEIQHMYTLSHSKNPFALLFISKFASRASSQI